MAEAPTFPSTRTLLEMIAQRERLDHFASKPLMTIDELAKLRRSQQIAIDEALKEKSE